MPHIEGELLNLVAPRLDTAVPDWRINSPELIAYPALPGEPGLELSASGEPEWRVDVSTPEFSQSLGDFMSQLHSIDPDDAAATGIETHSLAEVRQGWENDVESNQRKNVMVALAHGRQGSISTSTVEL